MEGKGAEGHPTKTMSGWICCRLRTASVTANESRACDMGREPNEARLLTTAHDTRRPSKKENNSQGERGMGLPVPVRGEVLTARGLLMPIPCQVSK